MVKLKARKSSLKTKKQKRLVSALEALTVALISSFLLESVLRERFGQIPNDFLGLSHFIPSCFIYASLIFFFSKLSLSMRNSFNFTGSGDFFALLTKIFRGKERY